MGVSGWMGMSGWTGVSGRMGMSGRMSVSGQMGVSERMDVSGRMSVSGWIGVSGRILLESGCRARSAPHKLGVCIPKLRMVSISGRALELGQDRFSPTKGIRVSPSRYLPFLHPS